MRLSGFEGPIPPITKRTKLGQFEIHMNIESSLNTVNFKPDVQSSGFLFSTEFSSPIQITPPLTKLRNLHNRCYPI
jgi:hypothetical protein